MMSKQKLMKVVRHVLRRNEYLREECRRKQARINILADQKHALATENEELRKVVLRMRMSGEAV